MTDRDFHELLTHAADGDDSAWRILVRGHSALLSGIARSYRLGDADAQDVSQQTWLTLARDPGAVRDPCRLLSWLATTARRQALRVVRTRRCEVLTSDRGEPEPCSSPETAVLADERRRALWRAVERLPDRERELMRLLALDPTPTHTEIGAKLGIAAGGVGPLRRRTLDRMRRMLENDGWGRQ